MMLAMTLKDHLPRMQKALLCRRYIRIYWGEEQKVSVHSGGFYVAKESLLWFLNGKLNLDFMKQWQRVTHVKTMLEIHGNFPSEEEKILKKDRKNNKGHDLTHNQATVMSEKG